MIGVQSKNTSFNRKIRVSLGLSGVLPLLLVLYFLLTDHLSQGNRMFGSLLVVLCVLLGFFLLRESAQQLKKLARETTVVGNGSQLAEIRLDGDGELNDIAENFNVLLGRLNHAEKDIRNQGVQLLQYAQDLSQSYERLKREEEFRNTLCRYLSGDLVDELLLSGNGSLLRDQRKPVTVLFADIRSFTALAEHMNPEEVVAMLNEYFTIMVDIVFQHNGMLDKLVGDQLMAIFGHLSNEEEGANEAVEAAIEMHTAVQKLMQTRFELGLPTFKIGIGINTGNVIFAHVGAENRMDYTVIGDTVNAAASLEEHAQPEEIIIGKQTFHHLPSTTQVTKKQELKVKKRSHPVVCYKVLYS